MIDLAVFIIAIIAGTAVGLLPGLPIWAGVFFLLPFADYLSALQIVTIWLGILIGSQYFGSVSTLLLKIPGETSSLVYLNDVHAMSFSERLQLVRQTAYGSALATIVGLMVVAMFYYMATNSFILGWSQAWVKLVVYTLLLLLLVGANGNKIFAVLSLLFGIVLSNKTNLDLPVYLLQFNDVVSNITVFSATLALLIVPHFLISSNVSIDKDAIIDYNAEPLQTKKIVQGTIIGCLAGLIPGMTATVGSTAAYQFTSGTPGNRIVAAESANNSAVITALLPLLLIGIPITIDEIVIANIFSLKLLELPTAFDQVALAPVTLGWCVIGLGFVFALIFAITSQRFLNFYTSFVETFSRKFGWIYAIILSALVYFDIQAETVNSLAYILSLAFMTVLGIYLHKRQLNALPFVFGLLLGDNITWSIYHVSKIYF